MRLKGNGESANLLDALAESTSGGLPEPRAWSRRPSILEKTGGRLQSVHTSQLPVLAKNKREYRRNVVSIVYYYYYD